MNILYLHGLDSKLSAEKQEILEKYGKVFAPDLDYYQDPSTIASIIGEYTVGNFNVVIGSSMGGFAAYYVSNELMIPALLFNPALKKRSVPQNFPSENEKFNDLKQIIIGQKDEVIIPADTLSFLAENINPATDIHIRLVPRLGHRIPLEVFGEEVKSFFRKLNS